MTTKQRLSTLAVGSMLCAGLGASLVAAPAVAASRDTDRDGLPNRWELANGTNPRKADARSDKDRDALTALREYRLGTAGDDDDSDDDGFEDGAEDRRAAYDPLDADSDDDDTLDGDEDVDGDDVDNEDEDDAAESCRFDDDDSDDDGLDDEDENEVGGDVDDADSDDDGVRDGDDDGDEDGVADEDEDDDAFLDDDCSGDRDGDGEDDEDEGDRFGTIESYDTTTRLLTVVTFAGDVVQGYVTDETEIEIEDAGDDDSSYEDDSDESDDSEEGGESDEGSEADLVTGAMVAEIEFADGDDVVTEPGSPGLIEEIEVYSVAPPA